MNVGIQKKTERNACNGTVFIRWHRELICTIIQGAQEDQGGAWEASRKIRLPISDLKWFSLQNLIEFLKMLTISNRQPRCSVNI